MFAVTILNELNQLQCQKLEPLRRYTNTFINEYRIYRVSEESIA